MQSISIEVTLFGETRTMEFHQPRNAEANRLDSVGLPVVGRFPTGTKLHRSTLTLWRRAQPLHWLRGDTAAVVNGEEYVADLTLYTHNRNVGRITGWFTEEIASEAVAKW